MRLILCFFAIHLIFFKSNADSSNYKIDLSGNGKSDKRKVDVISSDNLVVFNVFDQFGIGEAQVEKIKGEWPKKNSCQMSFFWARRICPDFKGYEL